MTNDRLYWCNSHNRLATAMINGKPCCNLNLAGILLPCSVVDLTDEIEFDKDEYVRQLKKVLTEEMEKDE